ncbi:MAG TPA: hypothetical protein VLM42_03405 [Bryobacteraceae bacterium]|nr:hypothetical protein [Bryobacteraceae bacterium]
MVASVSRIQRLRSYRIARGIQRGPQDPYAKLRGGLKLFAICNSRVGGRPSESRAAWNFGEIVAARSIGRRVSEAICAQLDFFGIDELTARHQSRRMVKRALLAALVATSLVCPSLAEETKVSVQMTGIGGMSCAHWQSTRARRAEGTAWIYGFWTGLNYVAAASEQAQSKIETAAIVAEVEKTCAGQPTQVLAGAAWATYLDFAKRSAVPKP